MPKARLEKFSSKRRTIGRVGIETCVVGTLATAEISYVVVFSNVENLAAAGVLTEHDVEDLSTGFAWAMADLAREFMFDDSAVFQKFLDADEKKAG